MKCTWSSVFPTLWYRCRRIAIPVLPATICHAIRIRMANTVGDGVVQKSRNFGWQPVLQLTCDQVRCPGSKWLPFFPKLKEFRKRQNFLMTRTLSALHVAGWKTKNNSSTVIFARSASAVTPSEKSSVNTNLQVTHKSGCRLHRKNCLEAQQTSV